MARLVGICWQRRSRYVALFLALSVSMWRWWDFHHHWMDRLVPGLIFGTRTDVRLDGLLMGCLAALLLAEPRIWSWAIRNLSWHIWFLCVGLYVVIQISSKQHDYSIWELTLLAVIVVWTVLNPSMWVGRILEYPMMRWVGRLSYSLYLWQELFAMHSAKYPLSLFQRVPLNLLTLFLVATLSYKFIERPMIQLGHRLAPPPTPGRQDLKYSSDEIPALAVMDR